MTVLDDALVPAAIKLLNKFGITLNYTQNVRVVNKTTGKTVDTPTVFTPKISPIIAIKKYSKVDPDGTTAAHNTPFTMAEGVYLAGTAELGFTPDQDDTFVLFGKTYRVRDVEPLQSGESIAAFRLTVTH